MDHDRYAYCLPVNWKCNTNVFNLCLPLKKTENLLIELQRNMPRYYYFVEFFFLIYILITSELQTERVTKNEWVHTICSSGDESPLGGTRGSAAFLQTLNKYVSYCFDASWDQNNVGLAAVLSDQDWNAIGQRGEFWTSCDRGYNGKNSKYLIKCYYGLNEWTHDLTFRERSFSVCIYIYLPFCCWINPI